MDREQCYYWVKYCNEWIIAKYFGDNQWNCGDTWDYESNLDEIGDKIETPEKYR